MRKKYIVILCVSLAVLIVCGAVLIKHAADSRRAARQYEELAGEIISPAVSGPDGPAQEPVSETVPDLPEETPVPGSDPAQGITDELYVSPVDFNALLEINPDVIGWITVPGTDIDFPILMSTDDNGYYLTHDIYGEEIISASIFIENYNRPDFSDFNTVVYGHNMNDGSMFGQLHRFEDPDFFAENRTFTVYLPDREINCRIFSARFVGDEHILSVCKNGDRESCEAYIAGIFGDSSGDANTDRSGLVTADDRIVTLSTCDRYNASRRYVVHGVILP